jgi:hypothetical protein
MRTYFSLILCLVIAPLGAYGDQLSSLDTELLLEKLEKLKNAEKTRSGSRMGTAKDAFDEAVRSDNAAHELYLKCVEKVRFEDEKLSGHDFRDWKRKHKEREDSPGFRRALRHQLNWLTLTLGAASVDDMATMSPKAMELVEAMLNDAEILNGQQNLLRQDVLKSVFASAYSLSGIEIENWPKAPLMLPEIYDKVIFPPLRNPEKLESLKSAWIKRILQEGTMVEEWGRGGPRDEPSVDMIRFVSEKQPELQWEMETDLFKAGDQKKAALRMLAHIEKNFGHLSVAKWIQAFEALVKGRAKGEAVTGAGGTGEGS